MGDLVEYLSATVLGALARDYVRDLPPGAVLVAAVVAVVLFVASRRRRKPRR